MLTLESVLFSKRLRNFELPITFQNDINFAKFLKSENLLLSAKEGNGHLKCIEKHSEIAMIFMVKGKGCSILPTHR